MSATSIPIFDLAEQRLTWTEQRQALLARNIANVTTPGFHPYDVKSFKDALSSVSSPGPVQTQAGHLSGTRSDFSGARPSALHARAPDGNAVVLDEQLTKVADTETMQSVATSIYRKYMGMFSIVLGRS
jgi:flagellar basal-body rod protein FlgB